MKQKIYHIIIFLLFWFCGVAYSQNPKADILQQDLSGLFDNLSMIGILGEDCSRIDIHITEVRKMDSREYEIKGTFWQLAAYSRAEPSPGRFAYRTYLAELEKERGSRVRAYAFRDKRLGWKNFSVVATFENGETHTGTQTTDPYLYGFLQNLYLRPSCHECGQLRGKRHAADITLADLWGAETICPERDDDTGLSLVMTHTQKGRQALDAIGAQVTRFAVQNMESMTRMNPSLVQPSKPHDKRAAFFKRYRSHGFESERVMKLLRGPSAAERAAKRIAHLPVGAMRRIKNLITK